MTSQDVAMLFDTSTSITEEGFWSMKSFATFMIQLMELGSTKTRVCLVKFPMRPTLVSSFTKFSSTDDIESTIGSIVYGDGDTGTFTLSDLNLLYPNTNMHILHTALYTFLKCRQGEFV